MKRLLLSLNFILVGFSVAFAQIDFGSLEEEQIYRPDSTYNTWSISVGYGPVIYYTDVIDYTLFPSSNLKLGPSVQIAKQLGRSWALEGEFIMADMYGQKYNRYFEGDFREASLNVKAYINQLIFNGPLRDRWNIYAKVGLGVNFFRSTMREQGTDRLLTVDDIFGGVSGYPTSYSDWDPDDYLVMGYERNGYASADPDLEEIGRESGLVVPIALGVRYRVNKSFDFGVETSLHNMVADNMDVDMTGADNDSYMHAAFSLTYKIGKKDKRHASWTYKDFNLSYERDRLRDPLAHKLDSLRAHLDELAALNDSAVGDTTYISQDKTIRHELFAASVFFDFDKSEVTSRSHRTLAGVARYMTEHPEAVIKIQGYTDDRGSFEYNEKLSERRCFAIKDVMVKDYGLDASRFVIEPKGKVELLSDTRKLAPRGVHLVNRRVDIFQVTK
jgi:outer membrane protein OmpA-like peptidoglycan-associated protein